MVGRYPELPIDRQFKGSKFPLLYYYVADIRDVAAEILLEVNNVRVLYTPLRSLAGARPIDCSVSVGPVREGCLATATIG